MANTPPHAYIAVFKGAPLDYQKYRHTSICIKFSDLTYTMIDITGAPTRYSITVRPQFDPSQTPRFAGYIEIGALPQHVTSAEIAKLAYEVPPNNNEASYNCQTWVGDALNKMVEREWISKEQADTGIDRMIDKTMEAADESAAQ